MDRLRPVGLMPMLFAIGITIALFTLAACSQMFREPPGISYAESVRQLGIYPVYPPREDLQVGDIYGIEDNQRVERSRVKTVFVDSYDLTAQIREYLNRRYTFGATNAGTSQAVHGITAELPSQSDAPPSGALFDSPAPQNLPITGFPTIEVDSGLTLAMAAGSSSIGAAFGFGGTQTLKMTLSYGRVTSYSVPVPVALEALETYCQSRDRPLRQGEWQQSCSNTMLSFYINEKYQLGTGAGSVKKALPLMVSKVYLARAISYTFNDRSLAAAAASVANRDQNPSAVAPTINAELLSSAVSENNTEMVSALANFQRALNQSVVLQSNTEGATMSIAGYTSNSVTFQEIFQRPVVIGYEGVYLPATK